MEAALEHYKGELKKLRSGRESSYFDSVTVEGCMDAYAS